MVRSGLGLGEVLVALSELEECGMAEQLLDGCAGAGGRGECLRFTHHHDTPFGHHRGCPRYGRERLRLHVARTQLIEVEVAGGGI